MARLTGALTQGLMNPTYTGTLGQAAGMLGSLGGDIRKARLQGERADALAGLSPEDALKLRIKQAKTGEEAMTAMKALEDFQSRQAQEGRAKAAEGRASQQAANIQADRDLAGTQRVAQEKLGALGTSYDRAMRANNSKAAEGILARMEKAAEGTGLNVRDYIDTSREPANMSKRYDQVGDYMFDTKTGQFLSPNPDGSAPKVERMTEDQHRKFVTSVADDNGWQQASLDDYNAALASGKTSQEAAKLLVPVDSEKRQAMQKRGAIALMDNQLDIIDDIEAVMPEDWSDQVASQMLSWIPGSDAMTLNDAVETLEARMAFDELQTMRENSKTGGALGSVSEKELSLLKAAFRNLNPASDQFPANLQALKDRYMNIISIERGAPDDFDESGISATDPQYRREADPKTGEVLTIWTDRRTGREYNVATFEEI